MENKTKEPQDSEGKNWTWTMWAGRNKTKQNWKSHSEWNCWNSARLELRSQVLTCSNLRNLGWSGHGNWRWQGYHVQVQFQSPMITNRTYKNEGPSEKFSFNGEKFENFKKKPKNPVILWRKKQKNHKILKAKPEHEPWSQEEINWSKFEKSIQKKTV